MDSCKFDLLRTQATKSVNEKILLVILVVMHDKFRVTFEYGVAFATHYRFSGIISII